MIGCYFLFVIALWLLVGWFIYRLWNIKKPTDLKQKIIHIVIGFLLFSIWSGGGFWEVVGKKMYWDAKVRELCAVDGGVKVYETVELTSDLLDQFDRINIPYESELISTDKYFFKRIISYYRKDDPQVSRWHTQIIRYRDYKVLGEMVRYGRGGGDLYGPWSSTTYHCPPISKEVAGLELQVFIEGEK